MINLCSHSFGKATLIIVERTDSECAFYFDWKHLTNTIHYRRRKKSKRRLSIKGKLNHTARKRLQIIVNISGAWAGHNPTFVVASGKIKRAFLVNQNDITYSCYGRNNDDGSIEYRRSSFDRKMIFLNTFMEYFHLRFINKRIFK